MTDRDAAERRADAAARRAAQRRFDAPLVLEAGAGTGKTTVLVARILAWSVGAGWERAALALAEGRAPASDEAIAERVLGRVAAITFTEAAAAEMESRAMQAYAALAAGEPVVGFDAPPETVAPERIRSRARALLGAFDHLHVQTIHAFCRRLLAAHPLEAGLHPRFVIDARGNGRASVAREVVEARVRAMGERADPDLEALLHDGIGAADVEAILRGLLEVAVPAEAFAADPLDATRVAAWASPLREAAEAVAAAEGGRFAGTKRNAKALEVMGAVAATRDVLSADVDLAACVERLRAVWTATIVARLGEWARDDFGKTELATLGDAAAKSLAAAAGPLHDRIAHAIALEPALLASLHRTLAPLVARAETRLVAVGAESFDALLRRTRDLLVRHPEVASRERRAIDQLLVDEFQDTDALQCEIAAALALEGPPDERPALFLVGDPKQSVYGWRNAEIEAYMRFAQRVCAEPGAERHVLCVSYRSGPALLDEVERVVAPAMVAEEGVQPEFQRLVASAQDAPAVFEYWSSQRWDAASGAFARTASRDAIVLEARHLAADLLAQRAAGVAWREMAVLLRSTTGLDEYLVALREAGVPYTVDRDRSYYQRREVQDAAALVCAVLDPADRIALVATLRSAWVGVPDAAWAPLWAQEFPRVAREAIEGVAGARERVAAAVDAALRAMPSGDVPGLADLAGWELSLVHAVDVLASLRRVFEREDVDRFVEALRNRTLCEATAAARHPGRFRLANLARFFREVQASLEEHVADVAQVLRALRSRRDDDTEFQEGRPRDSDEDAVQVMTIHGAKGLDFEVVYVMQMHKGRNTAGATFAGELRDGVAEWCVSLDRRKVATLGYGAVRARRDRVDEAERVRTLYVALTRAKRRLVMAGCFDGASRPESHAALVRATRGADLDAARDRAVEADTDAWDAGPLRVRFLGRSEAPVSALAAETAAEAPPTLDRVRADAESLAAQDAVAALRAARPMLGRASEKSAEASRESAADRVESAARASRRAPAVDFEIATAIGTAIHALLERFDWDAADPDREWEARTAEACAGLASRIAPERLDEAIARARASIEALARGPLAARLRELAPFGLAREVPVLMPGAEDGAGPVGAHVGAIDWIYWDPRAREAVVVDFKTERVRDASELADRVRRHRPQAERYREAAQEALGLPRPPRVELWFLDAARIETVEPAAKS
jgi:ATP-dependent helicase/nuclease subunit A